MKSKKHLQKLIAACLVAISGVAYSLSQNQSESQSAQGPSLAIESKTLHPQPTTEFKIELCTDGDTCRGFAADGKKMKVRLVGIDAPETSKGKKQNGQPFALEAKNYLNESVQNKTVQVKEYGTDNYGRTLGEIYFNDRNINLELVSKGFAEVYRGRPPSGLDTNSYREGEREAQKNKAGIWSQSEYLSPKDFRRAKKH